ncbi:MAG: hypothetical protein JKY67_20115, partial [Pseudomonadales bacterium]|nr:hypothetical protein [Pseudomonadales bacterium]
FMFVNDGLMREFIVGNNPWLNTRLFWLLICLACTTALLFTREFLSIRSRHPKMNAVILLVIGYLICGAILTIIHRSLLSNYIILTGAICCTSSLLASGTVSLLAGYYEAKFFLVAWAFIIVGGTVLTLLFLGVMPVTLYTLHAVHLGSAIEVLLLSFVLADRIKGMASEKLMIEQVGKADLENSVQYLEASQRLKNDFLETISHDFFAPINGVLNRVKLLGATSLNQEQTGFVNTITKSARSMMFLVDDLLMYTEKGDRNTLVSESFDLKEKLEYIHLRYLAKSQFKGLLFTYDVADDVPDRLIGDAAQLHIVLYNLLDNAVKFTERGSVRFKVIRRSFDTKSNQVLLVFRITDTGKGIPLDKQESIFSPFSTIEASSNRNQGGLGISMALCKKIADNMNAEIKLVSKEGAGTEVEFIVAFELGSKDDMRPPLFHKQ